MSQQVPFDDSGVPQGNDMNDIMADGGYGYADAGGYPQQAMPQEGYAQQDYAQQGYMQPGGTETYYGGSGMTGGYWQPHHQEPQSFARNKVPMIDPIESTKLTPQLMVMLVISGIKRHWKWSIPSGLVLGLIVAVTLYLVFPLQFASSATLLIRAAKPQFIYEVERQSSSGEFVNTQLALIKSTIVLERALQDPEVIKLPVILKQTKDPRGWLQKRLSARPISKSEIVEVSIETDDESASEKIVNAVVESYLKYLEDSGRDATTKLTTELNAEKRRMNSAAQMHQETIRAMTRDVAGSGGVAGQEGMIAGLAQGESLQREVYIAEAQLTTLRAKRTATLERIHSPNKIPKEVQIQLNSQYAKLNNDRAVLLEKKAEHSRYVTGAADWRMTQIDQEIAQIDTLLAKMINSSDDSSSNELLEEIRLREQISLWNIEQEIREKEILAAELANKSKEQLEKSASRSAGAADISFAQVQLARLDKTLDHIEDRIQSVQSESRAPGQIIHLSKAVSSRPNVVKQIMVVGMGAVMFSFFPLLLSVAIERMKPRLYHVSQVRRAIPQVLIGEIMEPPVSWVQGTTFRRRLARYRESVHNWCTHLLLSDPFRTCKTLSVASVAGDDGKTFLAVQIAVAMAQMKEGKVLLIYGDMRVGRLHLLFGNEETGIGLADVLSFRNRLGEAVVQNEKEPNLYLLSAGQLDVTPYELLGDGRFREMLDSLELSPSNPNGYSLIIVVVPPVANAAESLIMSACMDSTLLCVRQGETVLAAMEDVYRKLVNTGSSVDGIVVKDIPYYQMAARDGGFADKLEQIRLSHLLQYAD